MCYGYAGTVAGAGTRVDRNAWHTGWQGATSDGLGSNSCDIGIPVTSATHCGVVVQSHALAQRWTRTPHRHACTGCVAVDTRGVAGDLLHLNLGRSPFDPRPRASFPRQRAPSAPAHPWVVANASALVWNVGSWDWAAGIMLVFCIPAPGVSSN